MQDNKKGCRVKKNYSLMLYQRVTGDFYPINSEGKFTLSPLERKLLKILKYDNIFSWRQVLGSISGDSVAVLFTLNSIKLYFLASQ